MIGWKSAVLLTALLSVSASSAEPLRRARPWLVVVYGDLLAEPIVLHTEDALQMAARLTARRPDVDPAELDGRPYLDMAWLSGLRWQEYLLNDGPLDASLLAFASPFEPDRNYYQIDEVPTDGRVDYDLRMASRLYPAIGDEPAVFWGPSSYTESEATIVTIFENRGTVSLIIPDTDLQIFAAYGVPVRLEE